MYSSAMRFVKLRSLAKHCGRVTRLSKGIGMHIYILCRTADQEARPTKVVAMGGHEALTSPPETQHVLKPQVF